MKRSDSINTLEEDTSLDIQLRKNHIKREQTLRRSFSEDLPKIPNIDLPPLSTEKNKTRSRFSSAFRSLRGTKSTKKSASTLTIGKHLSIEDANLEDQTVPETYENHPEIPKTKKKKSKLAKKFSLSNIKKYKITPNQKTDLTESGTQTLVSLHRRTPEGGNLSISPSDLIVDPLSTGIESNETPLKFDSVRKVQITISGKKFDSTKTENQNSEDYLTISSDPKIINQSITGDHSDSINITESIRDTPPRERAPSLPVIIDTKSANSTNEQQKATASISLSSDSTGGGKGAIRKNLRNPKLKRQKSREEFFDTESLLMKRGPGPNLGPSSSSSSQPPLQPSVSFERGKRFPRPTFSEPINLETQLQTHLQYLNEITAATGNNLVNPNLSGSILDDHQNDLEDLSVDQRILFSVGKAVRPRQTTVINQTSSSETKDYSSISSNKSSDSQSPVSEASSAAKRRIRYIEQPTFYTDEEREILDGNREGNLSGISEYSFDSDFSVDTQMPAFGDLTMDHDEAVPIMTTSTEKREHLYKILVIGELGTGKTSFIKRYVHQFFSQNYRATIGVDFALKVLHWDQNTIVRLQLWDIAGQERFGNMTRVYYKEAVGAFIVFDVTRSGTFDCVSKWKDDLDSKVQLPDGSPIPCILLANKCDQDKQGIITTPEKMDEYVKENGFAGWFETSAKENINIEEAARALVSKILLNDKLISAADILDNDRFGLNGGNSGQLSQGSKRNCSC